MAHTGNSGSSGLMASSSGQFASPLSQLTNMSSQYNPAMEQAHNTYPMYSHGSTAASMLPQMTMSHPVMHNLQEVNNSSLLRCCK